MGSAVPNNSYVSWLHVTDFHAGHRANDPYWPTVQAALLEDIRRPPSTKLAKPDLIFFTGDLAFSGEKKQYEDVRKLLEALRREVGDIPVFACPGNHDLQRPREKLRSRYLWMRYLDDAFCSAEREAFWENESALRKSVNGLFESYSEFAQTLETTLPEGPRKAITRGIVAGDYQVSLDVRGVRLGIVSLNSAWRQFWGGNFEGKLTCDPRQFNAVTGGNVDAFASSHNFKILLQHHPPEWLANRVEWEGIIEPRFDLSLLGHLHAHESEARQRNSNTIRRRLQARSLYGLESVEGQTEERLFGYSWGRAEFSAERIEVRTWARTLAETPRWRFTHPESMDYTQEDGLRFSPIELHQSRPQAAPSSWDVVVLPHVGPINQSTIADSLQPDTGRGTPTVLQFTEGVDDWTGAQREQRRVLDACLKDNHDPRLAIYGFARIPLAIDLGFTVSGRVPVRSFQYHNHNGTHSWVWPQTQLLDPKLNVDGSPQTDACSIEDCVLRVSLSASISDADTKAVVPSAFEVDISALEPALTWLTSEIQLAHLGSTFAQVLADVRTHLPDCQRLHLFVAGPTAAAVTIGLQINPRMNPTVLLYEYSRTSTPRYRHVLTLGRPASKQTESPSESP